MKLQDAIKRMQEGDICQRDDKDGFSFQFIKIGLKFFNIKHYQKIKKNYEFDMEDFEGDWDFVRRKKSLFSQWISTIKNKYAPNEAYMYKTGAKQGWNAALEEVIKIMKSTCPYDRHKYSEINKLKETEEV